MTKGYKLLGYKLADNIFYCLHHREIITLRGTLDASPATQHHGLFTGVPAGARQRTSGQR